MEYYSKKLLLFFLRGLMYIKRGFVWVWRKCKRAFGWLDTLVRATIGVRVYSLWFRFTKVFGAVRLSKPRSILEFIGRRGTLQVFLFVVIVVIMLPHTQLYTKEINEIPGKKTVLYKIVGPGEEIDYIEEVTIDVAVPELVDARTWREGSVQVETLGTVGEDTVRAPEELSGTALGGTALTKPVILPGVEVPTSDGVTVRSRREIIEHIVQDGESIGVIAEKYGLKVETLLTANGLTEKSLIKEGLVLTVLPEDGVAHKVGSGDTVGKIALTYAAEKDEIIRANRLQDDGADIQIGETLIVPGGVKPKPITPTQPRTIARTTPSRNNSGTIAPRTTPTPTRAPAPGGYIWPTDARIITQYFGWRHRGLDIAAKSGTNIYAARAGTVTTSQCGWNYGYGCHIIIDHGGGVTTLYAHNSVMYVSPGQYVNQGQLISLMGSTGRSTGPHLHFEIRFSGAVQNPLGYIR